MMTYSIFKSFTIGTFLFVLSAPSAAFSPSSSLKVDVTQRLKSDLMYRKNIQIDARTVTSTVISTTSAQFKTNKVAAPNPVRAPKKAKHLVKIDFKKDLSKHLDVTLPYYSLENENAIVDDITGECHGIICTVKRDAPIGRETGDISMFDFLRAAGCVCTTAAVLANPVKKRHHYPAEVYSVDANSAHDHDKWLKKEISSIANCEAFLEEAPDPVFFMTCNGMTKRSATFYGVLKTKDTVWRITVGLFIISSSLFKRKFPPPPTQAKPLYASANPYENLSSKLQNINTYSSFDKDWVCMEGTLPPVTFDDCSGHFHDNPCLPHSSMIFHSCDLLGMAIGKLTGAHIPFKKRDVGQDYGLKLMSFDCTPQTLHFPKTHALKFQVKVYCATSEIGEPGSIYIAEFSAVQKVTELVCFTATGRFVLVPPSSSGKYLINSHNATVALV